MELLSLERQRECLSPVLMEREISQAVDRGTLQALLRSGKDQGKLGSRECSFLKLPAYSTERPTKATLS
ncbi:Dynein Heavy Chain 3, Axonemal [Manis pentadactyla]|nr:Dynein Heavy Chain 3, Axonemal [Manis pentadactyla]